MPESQSRPLALRTAYGISLALFVLLAVNAPAQDSSKPVIQNGYAMHQSIDFGGHAVNTSGNIDFYNTLVGASSGPRLLGHTLDLRAVPGSRHTFFDTLSTYSFGYGGDNIAMTSLRASKGKLYDFNGTFRRSQLYFNYNLLGNPLNPAVDANNNTLYLAPNFPVFQVNTSPNFANNVRRMLDLNATILPLNKISIRLGYSSNDIEGWSGTTLEPVSPHMFLYSNNRISTDNWLAAVDWKPVRGTLITYEQIVTHAKNNTFLSLPPFGNPLGGFQLSNGTPVQFGFDGQAAINCGAGVNAITPGNPPILNEACSGALSYRRAAPTRAIFPTEELRFQSSHFKNLAFNGRFRYTGANMNAPDYLEQFNGLSAAVTNPAAATGQQRTQITTFPDAGATAKRISVAGDIGATYQISRKFSASDQYDFWNFRQPSSIGALVMQAQCGLSMFAAPGSAPCSATSQDATTTTAAASGMYLAQKTNINTLTGAYQISPAASISLGWRYRAREIIRSGGNASHAGTDADTNLSIHENTGILSAALQPTRAWKVNGSIELGYANNAYTQVSPRQTQRYTLRSTYRPKAWATIGGTFFDLEHRNNIFLVNHLDHNRSFTFFGSVAPNEHWAIDLGYGYSDVYSVSGICYSLGTGVASTLPDGTGCSTANNQFGNSYFDTPTHSGNIDFSWSPIKVVHTAIGYHVNSIDGAQMQFNPRQVPGTLQSKFQTPYFNIAWQIHPEWTLKADWNYYGYGEQGYQGLVLPRNFHANNATIAMRYAF